MSSMPRIVAVVVNYMTADVTLECVESLLLQTGVDLHVTVVDNHSGDDSPDVLQRALGSRERVSVVLSRVNGGFARGNNLGLQAAPDADYYLVCNPDIVLPNPSTLSLLVRVLGLHQDAHVVSPQVRSPVAGVQGPYLPVRPVRFILNQLLPLWFRFTDEAGRKATAPTAVYRGIGAFFLIRGESFRRVGLFDPQTFLYFEEEILVERLRKAFGTDRPWLYDPTHEVLHRDDRSAHEKAGMRRWNPYTSQSACYFFQTYLGSGALTVALVRGADLVRRYLWSGLVYRVRRVRR